MPRGLIERKGLRHMPNIVGVLNTKSGSVIMIANIARVKSMANLQSVSCWRWISEPNAFASNQTMKFG